MQNPEDFIRNELGKIFVVKPNSIGHPNKYLGNKVSYIALENGRNAWRFSLSQYVQDSVKMSSIRNPKKGGLHLNVKNLLGLVTTDPILIFRLSSLHQEPPTTNI